MSDLGSDLRKNSTVILDDGVVQGVVNRIDFTGGTVTVSGVTATVPLGGGGGGTTITVQDEGITQSTTVTTLNFTGAGVTASGGGAIATIDVPAGGGGVPTTRLINTTAPLAGGGDLSADRTLSIPQATGAVNGFLSSADWTTFNNKGSGTVTSVGATAPLTSSGGATPVLSTSMNTARLIGRGTAAVGVMEEITLGTNLSFSGTTLNAASGGASTWNPITATVTNPALWSEITVSVPGVIATNKVSLVWGNTVDADANDMAQECTVVKANAGTDVIVITLSTTDKSFLFGPYKFLYQVSA